MTDQPIKDINKYEACGSMHTALRKCCDSHASSALYNLIWILKFPDEFNPWIVFGELVAQHINQTNAKHTRTLNREQAILVILKLSVASLSSTYEDMIIEAKGRGEKLPERCEPALYAVDGVLQSMDDEDLGRMGCYL
jgi:hypothetical protein